MKESKIKSLVINGELKPNQKINVKFKSYEGNGKNIEKCLLW